MAVVTMPLPTAAEPEPLAANRQTATAMGGDPARDTVALPQRLPCESGRIYDLFTKFVHLGPGRTYQKMSVEFGRTPDRYQKLGQRYQWLQRAEEYDALVRLARAQAFEIERQEAEAFRRRFEIERRQLAVEIARAAAQRVLEILTSQIEFVERRTREDGTIYFVPVGTSALVHISALMREFHRVSLGATLDAIAAQDARVRALERHGRPAESCHVVAGQFSVSDTLWDGSEPPPLPRSASTNPIAPEPNCAVTEPKPDAPGLLDPLLPDAAPASLPGQDHPCATTGNYPPLDLSLQDLYVAQPQA